MIGDRVLGVIAVQNDDVKNLYGPDDRAVLQTMANQAAVAIENARLYQQLGLKLSTTDKQREALQRLVGLNDLAGRFVHRVSNLAGTIPIDIEYVQDELRSKTPNYEVVLQELEEIRTQAQQLLDMASRIRESTQKLKESSESGFLQRVDVVELLDRALDEVRGAEQKPRWGDRIDIAKPYTEAPPMTIESFESLFTEALVNLITNAIEAMPQGGKLTLDAKRRQVEAVECVVLEITDTGVGIPAEDLDRIYAIDYSKKPGGFGYGLWLVQHICDATGTTLQVESIEGEGTTFRLSVPLAKKEE
jgi:signal transduction histidine kinase